MLPSIELAVCRLRIALNGLLPNFKTSTDCHILKELPMNITSKFRHWQLVGLYAKGYSTTPSVPL
jgi:hypothetical protein